MEQPIVSWRDVRVPLPLAMFRPKWIRHFLQNRLKRRFGCCERRKVSKYCIDYEDFQ